MACCNYLESLLTLLPTTDPATQTRFIATHLLCTLIGFVVKEETAVFFWSGDGYLVHDGELTQLESNNHPDYLAYQLGRAAKKQGSDGEASSNPLISQSSTFQTRTIYKPHCLAIATDGWTADLLSQLNPPQSSLALQRWLNLQAKERGNFEDDGAISIWWRDEQ